MRCRRCLNPATCDGYHDPRRHPRTASGLWLLLAALFVVTGVAGACATGVRRLLRRT